jgi:two-component system C4-dicarboxylate transport sensor histidine kinase DctB
MKAMGLTRAIKALMYLIFVGVLGWGVWSYGYGQALGQLSARGQSDLALAADRLVTGLQRYRSVAVLLSDHPDLGALHDQGDVTRAQRLLQGSADKTGAMQALYVDAQGQILAATEGAHIPDLTQRRWFGRALDGALGVQHGILPQRGRVFFYAAPSFGAQGQVRGVVVMVVDVEVVEREWRGSRPAVMFHDANDQIFITNRSEMLFWRTGDRGFTTAQSVLKPIQRQQMGTHMLWHQDFSPYVPKIALHLTQPVPVIGMQGQALVDAGPARRIALLQAVAVMALFLAFGLLLFLATVRRHALALANAQLEERVHERTRDLEAANTALQHAQADLVQAGKLSALGQMSAGISHELNQPLMAIRQFAENGAAFIERGNPDKAAENLTRIGDLSKRAARIIKNLRAFARNESEPLGQVDLVQVLSQAIELTDTRIKQDQIALHWDKPDHPIYVVGGEVRLTQVFVNLINNAADAMADTDDRRITLAITQGPQPLVTVEDTGPGIADPEKVFEPFYTTKQVGGGMGLGLSISYGLVQSFGGKIRGSNTAQGALFSVELDGWSEGQGT